MTTSGRSWSWKLGLSSWLVMSEAIASSGNSALAQIAPDTTLGNENSTVTSTGAVDTINGGATRGANLFHSFGEFNVEEGRAAVFTNPGGIENILSRVTGGNPSNIQGTLGVAGGNANLFLINPNDIIFGSNARLDVGGSFVATTANAIGFGNQGFFSAAAPNAPELLTVNPSSFFFNQIAESITNQSVEGLQVPVGQSLLLVGGNVRLDGGKLTAPGGQVELGGLASFGTVGLNVDNNQSLSFPGGVPRADVSLTNGASVDVTAGGGGSIVVNAQNLDISGGSSLLAGIGAGLGSVGTQAGNIEIGVTDRVTISSASDSGFNRISNLVNTGASGNAGNIAINTGSLNVIGSAVIGSATIGQGNAGSVNIQARDTVSFLGINSGVISSVGEAGIGNGADINIQARSLSLANGVLLAASTLGQGNAGNIQVNATDSISVSGGSNLNAITNGQGNAGNINISAVGTVSFDGVRTNGLPSGAFSSVTSAAGTVGDRQDGNINIQAGSLSLTNGAQLNASTQGQGNAGNIQVNTTDSVSVSSGSLLQTSTAGQGNAGNVTVTAGGTVSFDSLSSGVLSLVEPQAVGKGGDINVQARSLSLTNGAQLATVNLLGQGNAGNIQVNATDSVSVSGGSLLQTFTAGQGNAGNITIQAGGEVSFDGVGANPPSELISADVLGLATFFQNFASPTRPSGASSSVVEFAPVVFGDGKGGNINIQAGSLSLTNGAVMISSTLGQGDAGSISVQTNDSVSLANSFIAGTVGETGVGNGADINIQTRSLSLIDGAEVQALTRGKGNAGNIRVNAIDFVDISGVGLNGFSIPGIGLERGYSSGLFTSTEATASGQGGEIAVATGALRISDGAVLDAKTRNAANGGNIFVNVNTFEAINGGQILTTAFSSGRAGNIDVDATNSITLSGSNPTFSTLLAQFNPEIFGSDGSAGGLFARTQAAGTAGNLTITTGQLQVLNGAEVTVSGELGRAGNLSATANSISLDRGNITAVTGAGEGGNITLQELDLLLMGDNSLISAEALRAANGGNVDIDAGFIVAVPSENSDITANAYEGRGGNVRIASQGIFGLEFREQRTPLSDITASSEFGIDGVVELNTPDIDPSRGLVALPAVPVDTEVAQACTPGGNQATSEFVVTGRGGLPPTPTEALSSDAIQIDWVTLNPEIEESSQDSPKPTAPDPAPIIEAQGWVIGDNGEVVLTASAPTATPRSSWQTPADCHASKT